MNVDEAEHYLKYAVAEADVCVSRDLAEEFSKAFTVAKIAIGKQRPMKPLEIKQRSFTCPMCGLVNRSPYDVRYCSYCGQSIDWSGEDV